MATLEEPTTAEEFLSTRKGQEMLAELHAKMDALLGISFGPPTPSTPSIPTQVVGSGEDQERGVRASAVVPNTTPSMALVTDVDPSFPSCVTELADAPISINSHLGILFDADGGGIDRLSRLPNPLLRDIISRLPIKDAMRTEVLSRRWTTIWCDAPLHVNSDDLTSKVVTVPSKPPTSSPSSEPAYEPSPKFREGVICDIDDFGADAITDELLRLTTEEGKLTVEHGKEQIEAPPSSLAVRFEQDTLPIRDRALVVGALSAPCSLWQAPPRPPRLRWRCRGQHRRGRPPRLRVRGRRLLRPRAHPCPRSLRGAARGTRWRRPLRRLIWRPAWRFAACGRRPRRRNQLVFKLAALGNLKSVHGELPQLLNSRCSTTCHYDAGYVPESVTTVIDPDSTLGLAIVVFQNVAEHLQPRYFTANLTHAYSPDVAAVRLYSATNAYHAVQRVSEGNFAQNLVQLRQPWPPPILFARSFRIWVLLVSSLSLLRPPDESSSSSKSYMDRSCSLIFDPDIMLLSACIVIYMRLLDSGKDTLHGPCALLLKASAYSATAFDQDAKDQYENAKLNTVSINDCCSTATSNIIVEFVACHALQTTVMMHSHLLHMFMVSSSPPNNSILRPCQGSKMPKPPWFQNIDLTRLCSAKTLLSDGFLLEFSPWHTLSLGFYTSNSLHMLQWFQFLQGVVQVDKGIKSGAADIFLSYFYQLWLLTEILVADTTMLWPRDYHLLTYFWIKHQLVSSYTFLLEQNYAQLDLKEGNLTLGHWKSLKYVIGCMSASQLFMLVLLISHYKKSMELIPIASSKATCSVWALLLIFASSSSKKVQQSLLVLQVLHQLEIFTMFRGSVDSSCTAHDIKHAEAIAWVQIQLGAFSLSEAATTPREALFGNGLELIEDVATTAWGQAVFRGGGNVTVPAKTHEKT